MALQVIGAGLGRTGTLSLKLALEHIGIGPCYHMTELMAQASRRLPPWFGVIQGAPDWDAIFDGFVATVDYPTCTYWRELAEFYPEAKVVLSMRSAESWYQSIRSTIFSPQAIDQLLASPIREFFMGAVFGSFVEHLDDRDTMIAYYNRWNAEVIAGLPPERLLVHEAKQGWEPLCRFLGVPVPAEPYPRVNSKEDMLLLSRDQGESGEPHVELTPEAMEQRIQAFLDATTKAAWS